MHVILFFSFIYQRKTYPCALVEWFKKYSSRPDKETGMWKVRPHFMGRCQLTIVIHLDSFLQGAHLLPVLSGATHLPVEFHFSYSLDAFEAYFVNKYADNQMYEILYVLNNIRLYPQCHVHNASNTATILIHVHPVSCSHPVAMPFRNFLSVQCSRKVVDGPLLCQDRSVEWSPSPSLHIMMVCIFKTDSPVYAWWEWML